MSHDTSWDIEALRSPHEPQHQWELRRSFMEKHKSDFPMDRLVCLAQTLANMEFMGCRYPQDTMDQVWIRCKVLLTKYQVQELSRGLVEAVREKRAGKLKRTFVSGSEAASCKINRTSIKRPAEVEDATKRKVVNNKYGNFVAASTSKEAGELKNLEGFVLPPKRSQQELRPSQDFIGFCNGIINKANGKKEIAHETGIEKSALTRPEKERKTYRDRKGNIVTRESEVEPGQPKTNNIPHIGADRNNLFAQVKQGFFAENEKFSPDKVSSSQEGGEVFQPAEYKPEYKRHFEAQRQRANEQLESENSFYDEVNPMMASILSADPLRQFLLVTLAYVPGEHPCSLLNRSAAFSKMNVSWDYHGSNNCTVKINGQMISQAKGTDKKDARDKAAEKAIQILKGRCYTIEVKNQYLSDGTKVDLMDVEVNTSVGGKAEALGNSNVGHKLLSLMGWTGGGLGREGAGRAEPVTATTLFGREGLGNRCTGKHFKQKITKIVEEWMASSSPYDLVFTTGFDNDQRKDMHQVARRFNLKSKSYGKGDDRHLTISKKQSGLSLVEELVARGGETEKYNLIPPSETMDESEEKVFKKEEIEERVFSNNTRDYNRMTCSACNSVVKVHHLRRHLQNHNLSVAEYKDIYGSQYQYVICSWHRCGICDMEMLFDLDTLYAHVNSLHDVKIKDYVEQYLTSEDLKPNITAMDADGAPLLALQRRGMTVTALPYNPKPTHQATLQHLKPSRQTTHHKAKTSKLKPFEAKFDPQSRRTVKCYSNGHLERVQDRDEDGYLISNDLADYMLVECQICNLHKPMTQLRSHTKAAHGITITEYKAQFGSDLEPVEPVYHRCGICSQIIFLDSDAVAVHLKSGGHPRITHKDYNDTFMVDTRSSRHSVTPQEKEDRAEQRLMQGSPTISHRGLGGSVRGSVVRSTSSPLRGDEVVGIGTKMVPTRGRGWAGLRRGRGRPRGGSLKRSYEDDGIEYEADIFEGGNEISHGRKSRRRARMGEGAYSEKSYDALLKMQQQEFECGNEWGENEEWEEGNNYEDDWGEDAWREVKQEEEEEGEGDEEWNPKVEAEDVDEEENVEFTAEDSNSTSSFGNHPTKSLHLGPTKLEVILLDDNADDPDEKEEEKVLDDEEQETPMFNFNTFSTYNDKVVKARSESTEQESDVLNDNLNSVEPSSKDQSEVNSAADDEERSS